MLRFGKYALTTFKSMHRVSKEYPLFGRIVFKLIKDQRAALKKRGFWKDNGLQVPPVMIFSITNQCNLNCVGCYHRAKLPTRSPELSDEKIGQIFNQAQDLGIGTVILAGGEPLSRKNILEITSRFPNLLFLLFTNGTLIDDEIADILKRQPNIVTVFSIEGFEDATDLRRGEGIYKQALTAMGKLKERGIVFGTSITLTSKNFASVTSKEFIEKMIGAGNSLFFFADFIPVKEGTKELMPSNEQRYGINSLVKIWRRNYPSVFMAISEEDEFGGCLSAGIGFIHINPEGDVEPCPMSPVSDTNLNEISLKEALQSELLKKIRENRSLLNESEGGCALYDKKEWVRSLVRKSNDS